MSPLQRIVARRRATLKVDVDLHPAVARILILLVLVDQKGDEIRRRDYLDGRHLPPHEDRGSADAHAEHCASLRPVPTVALSEILIVRPSGAGDESGGLPATPGPSRRLGTLRSLSY